jgi:hypothetical protein
MNTKEVSKDEGTKSTSVADLDMNLEVVVIPVSESTVQRSSTQGLGGGSTPTASVKSSVWSSSRLRVPAARSNSA